MTKTRPLILRMLLIAALSMLSASPVLAWDALGHRLSAYLAYDQMNEAQRRFWVSTLQGHPRYQQDFVTAMPAEIAAQGANAQARWQFGQAAVWPDIARGFRGLDERFHFPDRHWIDGAWVRDDVEMQGNIYIDMEPLPDIQGPQDQQITREYQADNVLTGLVYARRVLVTNSDPEERAIALCWLLHLGGDIHQPLHAGALYSPGVFPDGDRGGNGIAVDTTNLHAMWDGALRGVSLQRNLSELRDIQRSLREHEFAFTPGTWLLESRELLHAAVYPDAVISAIRRSERTGNQLDSIETSDSYRDGMRTMALQRIAEAGQRLLGTLNELHGQP